MSAKTCIKTNAVREELVFSKTSVIRLISDGSSYVLGGFRWFQLVAGVSGSLTVEHLGSCQTFIMVRFWESSSAIFSC